MSLIEEIRTSWLIVIFGCLLYIFGSSVIFWNEGRALHSILSLGEALDDAVTVNPYDPNDENHLYNNRIIHFCGPIIVGEPLTEPDYNIQVMAVKLKRRVQMFQWVEETIEPSFGSAVSSVDHDSRTYYYIREWRDKLIDHRRFYIQNGHHNPEKFPIESQIQLADVVKIGKYELGFNAKSKIDNYMDLTSDSRPDDSGIKLHMGMYYHSNDIFNPEIGDIRILFSFAGMEGEMYTIVGKLENNKLQPYVTSRKSKILLVYKGELSLTEVFKREHHTQRMRTWGFRFMGWVLLFFGSTCLAKILYIILSRIRFLSALVADVHQQSVSINIILSFSLALTITSLAWAFHRPWIGAGLMFAAASPFLYFAKTVMPYQKIN